MLFLNNNHFKILVIASLTFATTFIAAEAYSIDYKKVLTLQGGYANLNLQAHNSSYMGTDDDVFVYSGSNHSTNTGVIGIFIGAELPAWWSFTNTQIGLEYDYFGSANSKGTNAVGVEPTTSTIYNYHYHVQTQQLMVVTKLVYGTYYNYFHPNLVIGLGAAFNHFENFSATTTQIENINITPTFGNDRQTSFTYALGLGIDMDINADLRAGINYRFSDFGSSSSKNGRVVFGSYQASVPFAQKNSHNYANEIMINLTYVI